MYVVKRSGNKESVQFDKITNRLVKLLYGGLEKTVDPVLITQKICSRIYSGITTTELDNLASQICMGLITDNPDFGILGGRIVVSNHQKNTDESFYSVILQLRNNKDVHGDLASLINDELFDIVSKHRDEIENMIDMNRDYLLDYFGFKTLERSYLLKVNVDGGKTKRIVERPQHLFMRVAIGIHGYDFENVKKTYDNMSLKMYTHATPTLFNASTNHPQLSSCFLIDIEDSIEGIFKTYTDCGLISKWAGGIGVHISNIRSKGSYIRKTGGNSDGIMPLLRTFNSIARQFNQCFEPNTMIFTLDGPKEIQHITTKDYVITRDGTYKKVMNVIKNEVDKDILSIRSKYSFSEVGVTPEHEICVLRGCVKTKMMFDKIQQNMSNGTLKTEFISAKCLDENDFLCYPIPQTIVKYHDNSDNIRFYGIMLGDGHLSKKYNKTNIEGGVSLGIEHKQNTIIFVENFLKNNDIHYWKTYNDNSIQIHWTHTNLSEKLNFDYDDLYDENHEKIISNKFFHMSKTNTLDLIHGLIETDGSVHDEIYFSSTSKNIAEGMRFLLLKAGILCSGNIRDRIGEVSTYKNITTRKISYVLRIPKDPVLCNVLKIEPSKKLGYFSFNNTIYSRINSIKTKNYKGLVYDLNIDENHNYLTNMGLVHNSGKRLGSFAMYLEVHHADIFTFLDAKKNHGAEEERARDLFYALWICDLFMERVQENGDWFLMDPNESQNLNEVYGEEYNNLYNRYVNEGKYKKKIKARELWEAIISSQVETGTPYLCYKDHVNKKNNQKNIGIVKSSNLCVSGDTNILIRNVSIMNVPIKYLMNKEVEVWNGKQWCQTIIYKTGENQKLLKIIFSNSKEIKCTEYHKFYIQENDKEVVYEAKDLKNGMQIIPYTIMSEDGKNLTFSNIFISSIEDCLENEDTYCFNEPLEHKGIFNGIITGQCAEINEVSNEHETSVCLTSDTIIITEEGPKFITECDNVNVLSFYNNDDLLVKDQQYIKAKLINNGIKEVFEIDLVGGFPIKATKNHKFLVLKNRNKNNTYEWKTVEQLTLKDRINRPKIDPLPSYRNVDIKTENDLESLVVGWMIGDGWQRSYKNHEYTYGVCFGSTETYAQKIVMDYLNIIQKSLEPEKYGHNKPIKTYISKNGVVQWACSKKSFAEYFITKYGLEPKLGIKKNLSSKIKNLKSNKIASILSGYFSADGTVYRTEKKFYIGLSSSSKQLLIDTQVLLKCFGITSDLVFTEVKSRNRFQGKLTIQNRDSIKLFSKYINFLLCPEKKNKLEDGILNHKYLRNVDEKEWMSIRSIKSVGFENVYDLNVPNSHNFIANMVTTHNCNLGSICLPQILEYPDFNDISKLLLWKSFLTSEQIKISSYYEEGRLKIYTTSYCEYCKLLKTLLDDCGLSYEEIDKDEAEMLRIKSNPSLSTVKPFETVPQLFSIKNEDDIEHLGGYDDNWNVLSPKINYKKLYQLAYELTYNLNKVIDKNFYPTERTRVSNMKNRPIGLGVQGLSDVFMRLKIPFTSDKAREINKDIFETLYYGSMESSIDTAKIDGSYPTYEGSPLSEGQFQFNLWGVNDEELSGRWDWSALREKLMIYGSRNSLNIALMPTASTASIFGNNESFEVITSNLYTRNVLSGVFTMVNKYLIKDLISLDLWNQDTKDRLIFDKGSVQNLRTLPKFLREVYKTAFEVDQKLIIKMSADRGIFVCQSQSLNLFFDKPTFKELTACHFHGWKNGLKTGSYYIRTKSALTGQNFGLDPNKEKKLREEKIVEEEDEGCLNCGA
jgi:ribonucleotide reductase alpha subunit